MSRDPLFQSDGTVLIPLTRGMYATIDQADFYLVKGRKWHAYVRADGNAFYAVSSGKRMHRVILGCKAGELGDHRDGDGLNNRRSNLRIGSRLQNSRNRRPIKRDLPVGVRQINGRFYARINANGRCRALGGFATPEEAHMAYAEAAANHYGEWIHPSLMRAAN